jgi:putative ABC transport system permease protein
MWFFTFVIRNLARRPFRTFLTVSAIAIAVCAVVALVGVTVGFEQSYVELYEQANVDLVVVRTGVRNPLTSTLNEELADQIRQIDGVEHVIAELTDSISFEDEGVYGVGLYGRVPGTVVFDHLNMIAGRPLRRGDKAKVLLGSILAANLGKQVGDSVMIFGEEEFQVVGIFETKSLFETSAVIMPLDSMQKLLAREGDVTSFSIVLTNSLDGELVDRVCRAIKGIWSGIAVMPTREHVDSRAEMRVARAMAWLTSAVALLIGGVGTFNTMAMSVHERTREIGILRAIGWRKSRIVRMVLSESMLLSVAGGFFGSFAAVALLQVLTRLPAAAGLIEGWVQPQVVVQGMVLAVAVGLLGGLMPAYAATRMLPTAAIHEE